MSKLSSEARVTLSKQVIRSGLLEIDGVGLGNRKYDTMPTYYRPN